jgi:hypothetical protein
MIPTRVVQVRQKTLSDSVTLLTLKLTPQEIELLATLASDQLFRREFIDPKMPGYKANPEEVGIGKALVGRLRAMVDPRAAAKVLPTKKRFASLSRSAQELH